MSKDTLNLPIFNKLYDVSQKVKELKTETILNSLTDCEFWKLCDEIQAELQDIADILSEQ
jgi:hypothetical protein